MQDKKSLDPKDLINNIEQIPSTNTTDLIECKLGLTPETIERSKSLTEKFKEINPATIISKSLKFTEDLVNHVEAGGEIFLINKDGTKQVVQFIGFNQKSQLPLTRGNFKS